VTLTRRSIIDMMRKKQLRISQPIHHQQNIKGIRPPPLSHPLYPNHVDGPELKRPRLQSSPESSISSRELTKIPKKKMHPMSLPRSLHQKSSTNHKDSRHSNHSTTASMNTMNAHKVSAAQINGYHPTHLYSSMLPIESEEEMMRSHRRESATNLINFSCIDYDSLVDYCKTFGLHRFEYRYHYDLAHKSSSDRPRSNGSKQSIRSKSKDAVSLLDEVEAKEDGARIRGRDSSRKREMDDDEESRPEIDRFDGKIKKKRGRKSKKAPKNTSGTEHHYFNSDLLDRHYERRPRERIPKTFDQSTRLTKSELVDIVREHFLSTPLLVELNEIDVFEQFLRFILQRRNKLKKEFVARK